MAQRTPISAGNWKMHCLDEEADALCDALLAPEEGAVHQIEGVEVVVAPGFLQLARVRERFAGTGVGVAGQNMHARPQGAFTGEVSPRQLAEAATWVILGHSERRQHFGETDAALAEKVRAALEQGLKVILCLGETLEDRRGGRTDEVLSRQISAGLEGVTLPRGFVIAYEPVWAIGSGEAASAAQAQEAAALIRERAQGLAGSDVAADLRVLYGGSVKPENASQFAAQPDVDGALVGGASLDAEAFLAITRAIAGPPPEAAAPPALDG